MQTMVATAAGPVQPLVEPPAETDALHPGAKAGPWVVERELGRGGMGAVYAVHHEDIGKRAALKVMHSKLLTGSSAERILLEARVVNAVGHPNIVDIFETGTLDDGRAYIVMERLEGVPLSERADESKILPDQVIAILLQVCDALIAAHAANIVHRDLKLDNVFLTDNPDDPQHPRVKLLDWGIAKVISADVRHTIEGQLVGTPQYLSPEQARGAAVSPQTDVYSLGVMAYELFLEQLPFEAETSAEIMAMHLRATPPAPSELWPDIPASLEHLLLAMLAKDPEARPTMLTVAHTLELVRDELDTRRQRVDATGTTPPPVTPPPSQSRTRYKSAPGLAPTELAWPQPKRRWQFVVGAAALAASAAMFLLTRESDTGAAAAPARRAPIAVEAASAVDAVTQPTMPVVAAPSNHALAPSQVQALAAETAPRDIAVGEPVAATPAVDRPASRTTDAAPARASFHHVTYRAAAHRALPKAPTTPRRPLPLDPDGTIDPYQ